MSRKSLFLSAAHDVNWFAREFNIPLETVRQRLANCPRAKSVGRSIMYHTHDAAPYLVKPAIPAEMFIKMLKTDEMPTRLKQAYWASVEKEMSVRQKAGLLFSTADVISVFSDFSRIVQTEVKSWPQKVKKEKGLTPEQREVFADLSESLLRELHKAATQVEAKKRSVLDGIQDQIAKADALDEAAAELWEGNSKASEDVEDGNLEQVEDNFGWI